MKNLSKIILVVVASILVSTVCAFTSTANITEMEGDVNYVKKGATEWQPASIGTILENGDKIGSKDNSWVEISFRAGHQAKLGSNSFMIINQLEIKTSLELFKGELFSKVKKLSKAEGYEVKTSQSVASVRGTEFKVTIDENNGKTLVSVYVGSVLAKEIITGAEVIVPAGKYVIIKENTAPTEPDDIENLEKTASIFSSKTCPQDEDDPMPPEEEEPEPPEEEDKISIKEDLREEMREAVNDIRVDMETARNIVEDTKETDSSTGRSLRDVHGNLVRIEQYVVRPKPDTIQFINITKRSNYKYGGRMNVASCGARLDSFEAKATFNMEMPEKISDWFGFFKDVDEKDLDFHPLRVEIKTSNQSDSIIVTSTWDDVEDNLKTPVVKFESGKEGVWLVDTTDYDESNSLKLSEEQMGEGAFWNSKEDRFETWMISPNIRLYRDTNLSGAYNVGDTLFNENGLVRLGMEAWIIDNDGKILDLNTVKDGNPFNIIRNIAFESSAVCRYDFSNSFLLNDLALYKDPNNPHEDRELEDWEYESILRDYNNGTDFFSRNFDHVTTPDFIIPVLEEIAKGAASSM